MTTLHFYQSIDADDIAKELTECSYDMVREFARELMLYIGERDAETMNRFACGVSDAMSEFDQEEATS